MVDDDIPCSSNVVDVQCTMSQSQCVRMYMMLIHLPSYPFVRFASMQERVCHLAPMSPPKPHRNRTQPFIIGSISALLSCAVVWGGQVRMELIITQPHTTYTCVLAAVIVAFVLQNCVGMTNYPDAFVPGVVGCHRNCGDTSSDIWRLMGRGYAQHNIYYN